MHLSRIILRLARICLTMLLFSLVVTTGAQQNTTVSDLRIGLQT